MPEHPWPDSAVDPAGRETAHLDSLRGAGHWSLATAFARERRVRYHRFAGQPSWRVADAEREERFLLSVSSMPASAQDSLALADRARQQAMHAHHTDRLAVALTQGELALAIHRAILGPDAAETARSSVELGHTLFKLGRIPAADSLGHAARPVLIKTCGESHPWVAKAEQLLGWITKNFSKLGDSNTALPHYRRALRIRVQTEGPSSLGVADAQQDLANLLRVHGHTRQASALLLSALETRRLRLPAQAEDIASTLTALAILHVAWANWDQAAPLLREANAIRREGTHTQSPFNLSLSLNLYGAALMRTGHAGEAVPILREGAALRESLWVHAGESDPGRALFQSLNTYFELASALAQSGQDTLAIEAFERGSSRWLLQHLSPEVAESDRWNDLVGRLRRALPADRALIVYVPATMPVRGGDYPRAVCVLRASGPPRWRFINGPVQIPGTRRHGLTASLRALEAAGAWPLRVPADPALRRNLHTAWQEQFEPLEPLLSGVRELVVVMPTLSLSLPIECLVDGEGRFLVDRFRVSYAPSALLHALGRERASARPHTALRAALLVGDPALASTDSSRLAPLTHSRDEVMSLLQDFPASTVLLGAEANASRLVALAQSGGMSRYGALHFSTHAQADERSPLTSALVLAPNPGRPEANSRITAATIAADWRIDADLVSLASCRSSVGHATVTDGSMGLSQAFLAAGARCVLASLWPADDGATSRLMQRFYGNLAHGASRAEALREARCWLREWRAPDGSQPYAHPTYWAGFILLGDPG